MKALVTTSRMPVAIDEIRKLGESGHYVVAADTFALAPGNHSKFVSSARVTPSARRDTARFIDAIAQIVVGEGVDMVLPAFEEVFYLAKLRGYLPACEWFFPSFETLARLHDKGKFLSIAEEVGARVPRSQVVKSRAELADAVTSLPHFFAKPIFSRGGIELFTNTGPLAGALKIEDCAPTVELPWIVQEYVRGTDVCTFSIVQHGRVTGHSAYVHPREIEHAGGIVFESIDEPRALRTAQSIAEAVGYHGQLSLDFIRTEDELLLIECNPRPTAGVHLMSSEAFDGALLDKSGAELRITKPGVKMKYGVALVRDMILHWSEARADAKYLFSNIPDAVANPHDFAPALYHLLSYGRVMAYRRHSGENAHRSTSLMSAFFDDVCYNGEPISGIAQDLPTE